VGVGVAFCIACIMVLVFPVAPYVPPPDPEFSDYFASRRRAERLFVESLTPQQAKEWQQRDYITVQGSDGQRYVIHNYPSTYNVELPQEANYCAHVPGVPRYDDYLVQKLMLETNAKAFCKNAGKRPVYSSLLFRPRYDGYDGF
jgi:hypothetical protein